MTRYWPPLLYAAALTFVTYAADAADGRPARSAPVFLFAMWLVLVVCGRWVWARVRAVRNDKKDGRPADR